MRRPQGDVCDRLGGFGSAATYLGWALVEGKPLLEPDNLAPIVACLRKHKSADGRPRAAVANVFHALAARLAVAPAVIGIVAVVLDVRRARIIVCARVDAALQGAVRRKSLAYLLVEIAPTPTRRREALPAGI